MIIKASIYIVRNYLFLKNYSTSEGAVSHKFVYYQQLSIAHYQVSNNYFEWLPILVLSAFKIQLLKNKAHHFSSFCRLKETP